jgi:hypothetical protein
MRLLPIALALFGSFTASWGNGALAQIAPRHVPPSDTTVPVGARLLIQVIGEGAQIYTCTRKDGALAWNFQAPDAKLLDPATHAQLGTHGAGPMWRWNDGSAVSGKVTVSQASIEPDSLPWLLLAATPLGEGKGILNPVVWVRRSETHGGLAPAIGCDAAHEGRTTHVTYQALYTFYSVGTPAGQPRSQ